MRGRTIGLGLLAVGAFLLAGALIIPLLLVPALVKLPLDEKAVVVANGTGVDFFDVGGQKQLQGLNATVRQKVVGHPETSGAGDDVAVWEHGSVLKSSDGTVLNASSYQVCLDRMTALAVSCPSTTIDGHSGARIDGLTMTFPIGVQKTAYPVFDSTAGKAFPARFQGVETKSGLQVYRFEQIVPETVLQTTQVPGTMAGTGTAANVSADFVYSNTRTFWVEPTSGVIVTGDQHPKTVVRGPGGAAGVTLLAGTFTADDTSLADGVQRAKDSRFQITMLRSVLPWTMAGLGLLLIVVGFLLARRGGQAGAHRTVADVPADSSEPVRVPQVQ
jgi:hypothetical protein